MSSALELPEAAADGEPDFFASKLRAYDGFDDAVFLTGASSLLPFWEGTFALLWDPPGDLDAAFLSSALELPEAAA
ncbi:MAG: hypothetical protein RRY69_05690, partial [Oscillospiraceae bacterium]